MAESNVPSLRKQVVNNWQVVIVNYKVALEKLASNKNQLIENNSA